ncbi:hypothetical protein COEREDRAFT_99131 [Coemansia reversa NRRL 1564]|uniref:Uncharacterized protein n=1 Tax=Coemansia reversa (strain ATCC 12441 / NRRL 1564) TaxID=763665 RepID=A0A2G5B5B0_COERN|nr:hypothetical protein COEREDRAFT_99131 [Coemansia reversa NRRL 1564]|eukprot:PIA14180.1 hypothetical protein COEREDRAFT_99131 [Coemansia reversa NRRL 1564]
MDSAAGDAGSNKLASRKPKFPAVLNSETSCSPPGSKAQSSVESSEEDNMEDLFVAENEYVQLSDDVEALGDGTQLDPTVNDLDDAFNCKGNKYANISMAARFSTDLEQAIDDRLFLELEERQQRYSGDKKENQTNYLVDSVETNEVGLKSKEQHHPIRVDIQETKNKMPAEDVEQIKSIMAGIQLSEKAIPLWACRIPESEWMPQRKN